MIRKSVMAMVVTSGMLAVLASTAAAAPDKYTVKVRVGSRSPSSGDTRPGRLSPPARTEACLP